MRITNDVVAAVAKKYHSDASVAKLFDATIEECNQVERDALIAEALKKREELKSKREELKSLEEKLSAVGVSGFAFNRARRKNEKGGLKGRWLSKREQKQIANDRDNLLLSFIKENPGVKREIIMEELGLTESHYDSSRSRLYKANLIRKQGIKRNAVWYAT